jgi:hypothetical protein
LLDFWSEKNAVLRTSCTSDSATHAQCLAVTLAGSYMAERMGFRAKELLVEKAAMEEAMAKEEVRDLRCFEFEFKGLNGLGVEV